MLTRIPPKLPVPGWYIAVVTCTDERMNDIFPEPYLDYQFVVLECERLEDCPPHEPGAFVRFPITVSNAIKYRLPKMKVGDVMRLKTFTSVDGQVKTHFKRAVRV